MAATVHSMLQRAERLEASAEAMYQLLTWLMANESNAEFMESWLTIEDYVEQGIRPE